MPILVKSGTIAFYDIPKSASTSIKRALYSAENGRDFQRSRKWNIHDEYPCKFFTEAPSGAWAFSVVRDPMKRLLSVWGNRVIHHRDLSKLKLHKIKPLGRLPGLSPTPKADDFFRKLSWYRLISGPIRHHSDPVYKFLGPDLHRLDRVYRIDEIGDLEKDLSEKYQKEIKIGRYQTGGPKLTWEELSMKTQSRVAHFLRSEYEYLGDYFTAPENVSQYW